MEDEITFFSDEFVLNHRIQEFAQSAAQSIDSSPLTTMTVQQARAWSQKLTAVQYLIPRNFTVVQSFVDESSTTNLERFAEITASITHPHFAEIRQKISEVVQGSTTIHARYGDLIDGNWKQFIDPTKYISTIDLSEALKKKLAEGKKVFIFSDTSSIVDSFGKIFSQNFSLPESSIPKIDLHDSVQKCSRWQNQKKPLRHEAASFHCLQFIWVERRYPNSKTLNL